MCGHNRRLIYTTPRAAIDRLPQRCRAVTLARREPCYKSSLATREPTRTIYTYLHSFREFPRFPQANPLPRPRTLAPTCGFVAPVAASAPPHARSDRQKFGCPLTGHPKCQPCPKFSTCGCHIPRDTPNANIWTPQTQGSHVGIFLHVTRGRSHPHWEPLSETHLQFGPQTPGETVKA